VYNEELWREVSLQINYLGDSEYALAFSRAETKDTASIIEQIQKHRDGFEQGKTCGIGSATFASVEQWKALAAESERAARNELLKNSSELAELDRLEKAALEAQEAADAKSRELQANWEQYNAIPDRIEALNVRLAQIASDLRSLETEKIAEDFKSHYRATLNGAIAQASWLDGIAALLVTAGLRKEVLGQLAGELERERAALTARRKVLAKRLGQKV
jgi:hypothetical protein